MESTDLSITNWKILPFFLLSLSRSYWSFLPVLYSLVNAFRFAIGTGQNLMVEPSFPPGKKCEGDSTCGTGKMINEGAYSSCNKLLNFLYEDPSVNLKEAYVGSFPEFKLRCYLLGQCDSLLVPLADMRVAAIGAIGDGISVIS